MTVKLSGFAMFIVVLLSLSCNRTSVSLDFTNAKDQVPQLGNLVFRFSKALVPDSVVNRWDPTEYVQFEPEIPGRFRWEEPDELVFSPSRPLPPATSFKATLNSGDILQHSNLGRIEDADKIQFRTPDLALENTNAAWVLPEHNSNNPLPQLDLYFNYPVNPTLLRGKLKIVVDNKERAFTVQSLSADNRLSVRLKDVKAADKNYDVVVQLEKGLTPDGGGNGTTEAIEVSSFIASPFVLHINDLSSDHDGTSGTVLVKTSQQLANVNTASFLSISPAVKFAVSATDDGFMITSDQFDVTKSYELKINKGLRGKIGGVLKEEYENNLAFGNLEPSIGFANSKAVYLSALGAKNIEVRITNIPKVKMIVSKIYESNLIAAQRYGYYPADPSSESDYSQGELATLGDVVFEREFDSRSLPQNGNSRLLNFDLRDRLPDFKGIYHISIRSTQDYWINDGRFISLSDVGLIAKEGRDKMLVFANSIKTTLPVEGANVLVYGANNQLLGMAATNAQGVAEIAYTRKEFAGFKPAMVIAKTANDFNFLPFNSTGVATSRFDVGGKLGNATGLDAFIYAERDIYRPGEKVNCSVIIRDQTWKSPGDMPLKLKFLMPNGKELRTFRKTLNEQGSLEAAIEISPSAITGSYLLELYSSNDILLASKSFMIEEFVPDRIKVTAKLSKPFLRPGDSATLRINAVNFFGPPAANRNYEEEIQLKQKAFNPKKYANYDFTLANQNSFFDKVVREGRTDENGNASELYQVPNTFANIGILQATFFATVFDETGRPVSRSATAEISTQPIFAGLGRDDYGYYPLNQAIKFPVIAIDKNENLVNGAKTQVQIIKHEYRTVLARSGDYFRYDSQKKDRLVYDNTVTVNGQQAFVSFVPRSPGDYEVRVSLPGANSYVSRSFYSYGSWGGMNTSFEVNNEGNIDIEVDKASYLSGETANVLFKTPFSGKMLVTMEMDRVVSHQYVNVDKRTATLNLKLNQDHLPNVYITATLIKPHEISDIPLTVAHGFVNVKVEEKSRKAPVQIIAQKAVRSKTRQKVTVKALPNSLVTLAAVDNGVLQVSGFKTPDPYDYFYSRKALQVNGYDIYPLLFPEVRKRLSSTGGDGDLETSKRTNPMPNKRVKILSYWSGIVKANSGGEAKFEFDVPQFSGQVRLMAVAYRDNAFGSGEAVITVADPIVLSTALPRFLSPGDTVNVPVTISNTTGKNTSAAATLKVTGPLKIIGNISQSVNVPANAEARAVFRIVAAATINTGTVNVEVNGLGEKFTESTEISVRPPSTLQQLTGSGSIAGGKTQRVTINTSDFMPGSSGYRLVVSRSPAIELGNQLNYLMRYPYGCTEQVVSSAFPQLYYGDLAAIMQKNNGSSSSANANILEAVRKIKMRQLYNGALMLWDNEDTENWWVTIYAAHFLHEAKQAGYDIDPSLLETMLAYLNNRLRNRQTINYYYNRDQQKKIAPKEVAYCLYVLALTGRPNISVMNYYKANPGILSLDSRYLLSAAYAVAGDKAKFRELLPSFFSGEESVPQTGGSFYSAIRDEAISLNVLIDVDPGNKQVPLMARHVVNQLKQRSWFNTQESAFGFLAIGKLARAAGNSDLSADLKVNGKLVGKVGEKAVSLSSLELGGNNIDIATKGKGLLYYWWQSEGISVTGNYVEEDNYIKVRRQFFDRNGQPIESGNFRQNDLVIVKATIEKSFSGSIENVVITDLLPAGFEIENPRTKEIPGMDWIKDADMPTQLDVRDDRINLFVDVTRPRQTYYYAVRAVSPGVYRMGPLSAGAMYNGEYHSYHGAGTVRVVNGE